MGHMAGKVILRYLNSTKSPTTSLTFKRTAYGKRAPITAAFSSRGPNPIRPDLLKPNLTATGVKILAAWPGISSPTKGKSGKGRALFNMDSRTSMPCPHVSGLEALLISRHKEWSPTAVKSTTMTTAYNLNNIGSSIKDVYHGGPATPFLIGSAHVDIQRASDPGLHYLCSLKYSSSHQIARFDRNFKCPKRATMQPGDISFKFEDVFVV